MMLVRVKMNKEPEEKINQKYNYEVKIAHGCSSVGIGLSHFQSPDW